MLYAVVITGSNPPNPPLAKIGKVIMPAKQRRTNTDDLKVAAIPVLADGEGGTLNKCDLLLLFFTMS